jgi:protein-S-isoprenylcysteine O-methyltransferase Ste14
VLVLFLTNALVRNPLVSSAVVDFLGMALALGSYWAFIIPGIF